MAAEYTNKLAFWYCYKHDDGFLIKDNDTSRVPDWCKMCNSQKCDPDDWAVKGIIDYDGWRVTELTDIFLDYDRYCGGYEFEYFYHNYYTETGRVDIIPDSPLDKWFQTKLSS
jgi:hypothetical protein